VVWDAAALPAAETNSAEVVLSDLLGPALEVSSIGRVLVRVSAPRPGINGKNEMVLYYPMRGSSVYTAVWSMTACTHELLERRQCSCSWHCSRR
jgi:hypothetical protein